MWANAAQSGSDAVLQEVTKFKLRKIWMPHIEVFPFDYTFIYRNYGVRCVFHTVNGLCDVSMTIDQWRWWDERIASALMLALLWNVPPI